MANISYKHLEDLLELEKQRYKNILNQLKDVAEEKIALQKELNELKYHKEMGLEILFKTWFQNRGL